jgi:hypothetical protein
MDRNLGASQVANSSTDAASYGDLYQWGRKNDGHQIRTSTTAAGPVAIGSEGVNFITGSSDWLSTQDDLRWNSDETTGGVTKTVNDPCPTVYRVPTEAELQAEVDGFSSNNAAGDFNSVLKLPVAGYRSISDGSLYNVGSVGDYWSSTVSGTDAHGLSFSSGGANVYNDVDRAFGESVRCIKE